MHESNDLVVPVVVFAYNRPDLLRELLECLRKEAIDRLIVYVDGPKTSKDAVLVKQVRSLVSDITWIDVEVYFRKNNLGLGKSIVDGVTETLKRFESALVFEDDLVFSQGACSFLADALRAYWTDDRVGSVTGWTHPNICPTNSDQSLCYFDGKAESWSWGTWRRAWIGMEQDAVSKMNQCLRNGIDIERYGTDMPKMAVEEHSKNLWAVRWWYHNILNSRLCLRPYHTLVETTGWDGRGVTVKPHMQVWKNAEMAVCPASVTDWPTPKEDPQCAELWRSAAGLCKLQ